MKHESLSSPPAENELPLDIKKSERHMQGGESMVHKATVRVARGQEEKTVALKQAQWETFTSLSEMLASDP